MTDPKRVNLDIAAIARVAHAVAREYPGLQVVADDRVVRIALHLSESETLDAAIAAGHRLFVARTLHWDANAIRDAYYLASRADLLEAFPVDARVDFFDEPMTPAVRECYRAFVELLAVYAD